MCRRVVLSPLTFNGTLAAPFGKRIHFLFHVLTPLLCYKDRKAKVYYNAYQQGI